MQAQIASDTAAAVILNDELDHDFDLETEFDGEGEAQDLEPVIAAPRECREVRARRIAADLPDEAEQLIAAAGETLQAYDLAIRSDDPSAADAAEARYEAIVWKLNGGSFFASYDGEESAGGRIRNATAAAPGKAPMWGQAGEWLMDVSGIRVLVRCKGGLGTLGHHYDLHVVDVAKPFISPTGYQSHFGKPIDGATLEEALTIGIKSHLRASKKPILVQPSHRKWCTELVARFAWLNTSGAAQSKAIYEEASGQLAMAF